MQLPVDVGAVLNAATDIEGARSLPLSVSVLIDETAPGDLIGHVRAAFASASANVRVTIGYLGSSCARPSEGDDAVILVAGLSTAIGAHAASVRKAGVPAMVVTTLPHLVGDIACAAKTPIPAGDVVFPEKLSRWPLRFRGSANEADAAENAEEPIALDEHTRALLDQRMGEWIIDACFDKRLAFALSFPFVRRPLSAESVFSTSAQNAGIGLVMFIPGADMPIMTLNQVKMLLQIAAAYGEPLDAHRVKELACVVGGAFACRTVARQLVGLVPALGWAVKAGIGYAGTFAMGCAAIEYFEGGGNIAGVASVAARARDKAVDAARAASSLARS